MSVSRPDVRVSLAAVGMMAALVFCGTAAPARAQFMGYGGMG